MPSSRPSQYVRRAAKAGLVAMVALLTATACAPMVDVQPAVNSTDPGCAPAMIALPDKVADQEHRDTNSQATAAWGDPSKVILRCGVPVPGPTTDECASVNGIDWIIRGKGTTWTAITYGRTPAIEVLFDPNQVPSSSVLVDLGNAVARIPQHNKCLGAADVKLPS